MEKMLKKIKYLVDENETFLALLLMSSVFAVSVILYAQIN
jgi:hypothetical protein